MRVKRNQLIEGCILAEDISGNTNLPIVRKNTVLTPFLLKMINLFLVDKVSVEATLVNGQPFEPSEVIEEPPEQKVEEVIEKPFIELYLQSVQSYKQQFINWQSGTKVDMLKVRNIILPLIERVIDEPSHILMMHHYSTKADYLFHHAVSVGALSAFIGKKLNFQKGDWIQIGIAGIMSDSGMSKVSNRILNKKGSLTPDEYSEVKKHPVHSYNMLKSVTAVTEGVLMGVLQHHEREDGSGYPLGKKAKKVHAYAQIIAVSDVYHAMTSERHYRSKQSPYKVLEAISKDQFGKFQHSVVQTLLKGIINFSLGTKVRLSNGEIGEIIFIEQHLPTRPIVKLQSGEMLKLASNTNLFIEEVIV